MWGTLAFFLCIAVVITLVFVYVGASTGQPRGVDLKRTYRLRTVLFLFLTVLLLAFLRITLVDVPYPAAGQRPDRVVNVVAKQFGFALSGSPITNDEEWGRHEGSPLPDLPTDALIEFRVTSFDVNHGFGLYGPDGQLLSQTQAMPGYVNRLRVRFPRPGTYRILCMEYCGIAHHIMRAEVTVR